MVKNPGSEAVELRGAVIADGAEMGDGQLLECFVSGRDEAAFAALVRRHGPMVWGVCRRVLASHHDAEDAFQATFLVLVRKADSVRPTDRVGNWLYGVAHQTALKARQTAARRKGRERQVAVMPEPAVEGQDLWRELRPLLDQELSRLPDGYRAAIILCDLEGRTQKDAAQSLGVPEGTLSGRLFRGREMLTKRLARRGLTLSGAALAALLSQSAACVPTPTLTATIEAACLTAAGRSAAGVASARAASLAEGALRSTLLTRLAIGALLVLLPVLLCGVGVHLHAAALVPKQAQDVAKGEPARNPPPARRHCILWAHLEQLHEAVRPNSPANQRERH
jgi:RNA polymerase sigma factor (sigma-70 family)